MSKKLYLHIKWDETKEKNNQKAGDDGEYEELVEPNKKISLLGLDENSFIKEVNEDYIVIDISSKGEYTIKLNDTIKVVYSDGYQVAGDWVDYKLTFEITLSNKTLAEIWEETPDFEVVDNILVKVNKYKEELIIPEGVTEVGHGACYHANINKIVLPSTLKKIGSVAFCGCNFKEPLILPDGLEEIGWMGISYTNLSELIIPNSIKKIDDSAFIGSKFYKKIENKEFIIFGDGVLYLYTGSDSKVVVPEGVKIICPRAFYKTESSLDYEQEGKYINEIVLPQSVELIHSEAFYRLSKLKKINLNPKTIISKDAFKESNYQEQFMLFLKENNIGN